MNRDGGPDDDSDEEAGPELCDLCGVVIPAGRIEWFAVVPDSSAIHALESKLNGKRTLIGCSNEHLTELVKQYKRRPFLDAELWAGKITRALQQHPEGMNEDDLVAETGLTPEEVQRGVMWHNTEAQRWLEQFGQNDDEASDE